MQAVKPQPPKTDRVKKAVESGLLPWFSTNARDLPWRRNRTPYRVWVSEIMLQQTRVDTVIAYYLRWMKAFPSWKALATAPQGDVLKLWEGLGYYSRARNLHAAAQIIAKEYRGDISNHRTEVFLRQFPGIGNYTAAAIASLAFNEDAAVVDGNVIRVLSRLFAFGGDTKSAAGKKQMQAWADKLLVKGRAGEFNEAMMELGALVCLPKNPQCAECPLRKVCSALIEGKPSTYPVMEKKKKVPHITVGAAVTMNRKGEVLIAQRKQDDMLGGLWEFPGGKLEQGETIQECVSRELQEELGIKTVIGEHVITVKHAYSHFTMTMHVYRAAIVSGRPRPIHCADYAWVKVPDLGKFAYSKADLLVVEKLRKALGGEKTGKKVDAAG
ncbi:MAG: A/G-specific adenine glycosylase [Verrucomicrobia bacterium]|nr:A/G-specific adenine glycosylase [Verrucomicrobiota bacterium]